jgi:hypothetical protein
MVLNGWQRLFVVLAVPYIILIIFGTYANFPTSEKYYTDWKDTLLIYSDNSFKVKFLDDLFSGKISNNTQDQIAVLEQGTIRNIQRPSNGINDDFLSCPHSGDYQCAVNLREEYTRLLLNIHHDQMMDLIYSTKLLIIPLLLIYLFGWTIGWVCRGFHRK